jgi:hypothetical protein
MFASHRSSSVESQPECADKSFCSDGIILISLSLDKHVVCQALAEVLLICELLSIKELCGQSARRSEPGTSPVKASTDV